MQQHKPRVVHKPEWSVNKWPLKKTFARWFYLARRIPDRRDHDKWSVNNLLQELIHHRREHERMTLWLKMLVVMWLSCGIVAWMTVIIWGIKFLFA